MVAAGKSIQVISTPASSGESVLRLETVGALVVVFAALAWAYMWPMGNLVQRWIAEPDYNHGFLVPVFSAYLLWFRKGILKAQRLKGSWWGLAPLLFAAGMRLFAAYFYYPTMDAPSLIPCLVGIVLLVGGWNALHWSWPSIVFLVFMMPLPAALAGMFSHKLQRIATVCSTWLVQLCGIPAFSSGNVIRLTHGEIGIVEACSGLRMLMLFLAITVGASFLIQRPLWEKLFVAMSALVIGVVTNVIRITVTAILFEYVGEKWAHAVFHDLAGWLMMPMATLLLGIELWLLSALFITPEPSRPIIVSPPEGAGPTPAS